MFRWLTRKDGKRGAKASRRIASSRASVFSEFALIVPIVVLVCSALIEIVGYWDAQVMANHAAWQVGRIVMVRGSDGLEFSSNLSKKSKTGIAGSDMPDPLKKALASLDTAISGFNKFNNRGNIATLFLMSTCGIGYYGGTPGQTLSDGFTALVDAGVKALTDGLPTWIAEAVKGFTLPSFIGGGESGIAGFVNEIVKGIVDKITEWALKPVAEAIEKLLKKAFENILGKDGIKLDNLFNGKSAAARFARQMYGAGSRIARAKSTIGKEVLTVTDMDSDYKGAYLFAKRSVMGRLVYPQVVDKEAKSDGYFVTGVHGWPANDGGLAMVHVEINWPYEYGWLFPIVSGGDALTTRPVATGHSMVFPQPDIANENLYSEGATAFAPGAYTNNTAVSDLDDLANEMKDYLKYVKYGMRFRICEDTISLHDEDWYAYSWKGCPELKKLFNIGGGKGGGNYANCWSAITDGKDQDSLMDDLKPYFESSSYRARDYYYWEDSYHKRYSQDLVTKSGNAGLGAWYDRADGFAYNNSTANKYEAGKFAFKTLYNKHRSEINAAFGIGVSEDWLYRKIVAFADRNKVNVYNIVKWIEGHDLDAWKAQDREVHEKAKAAEKSFAAIKTLVQKEIKDIENMENGTSTWTGDEDDPVFDPNDEEVMKNPDAAAKKARAKWATMKANLKKKLKDVDAAAEALRKQWEQYKRDVDAFTSDRRACVNAYFSEACINTLVRTKDKTIFDSDKDSSFKLLPGAMPYDIGKGTREMLEKIKKYQDKLNEAYKQEVEYGALMGLESAGKAKREGKTPDQIVDEADGVNDDMPGSLAPGSDKGNIIDKDHQSYQGGAWKWN
jgi:hypothetical protein